MAAGSGITEPSFGSVMRANQAAYDQRMTSEVRRYLRASARHILICPDVL